MSTPPPIPEPRDALELLAKLLNSATEADPAGDGVAVVVAHPDDETIGAGGQLRRLRECTVVHVTDGAPRDLRDAEANGFVTALQYASARRRELVAAMREVGIGPTQLIALGVPDQQAVGQAGAVARRLANVFSDRKIRLVLTHAYEGGHPDHDASALAVSMACRLLERRGSAPPTILEMPFYHAGPSGPMFQAFAAGSTAAVLERSLDADDQARKARMFACFVTQKRVLAQFTAERELFRMAVDYDFRTLPNSGRLQYETWGLASGPSWLAAAGKALEELGTSAI